MWAATPMVGHNGSTTLQLVTQQQLALKQKVCERRLRGVGAAMQVSEREGPQAAGSCNATFCMNFFF